MISIWGEERRAYAQNLGDFYETVGGREDYDEEKCKGRSRKPLAEVYSLERPVARHFVCLS